MLHRREQRRCLARPRSEHVSPFTREQKRTLWEQRVSAANAAGPAQKNKAERRQPRATRVRKAKEKAAEIRRDGTGTGGGPPSGPSTDSEETILAVVCTGAPVLGFPLREGVNARALPFLIDI